MPSGASAQTFRDVSPEYWAAPFINALAASGITSGCGNENYCPEGSVTRAQMAVFLERGMNYSAYSPPAATGNVFSDVGEKSTVPQLLTAPEPAYFARARSRGLERVCYFSVYDSRLEHYGGFVVASVTCNLAKYARFPAG